MSLLCYILSIKTFKRGYFPMNKKIVFLSLSIVGLTLLFLVTSICFYILSGPTKIEAEPVSSPYNAPTVSGATSIPPPVDSIFRVSASSFSSAKAGRIGRNIILKDLQEAIKVTFSQTGRDRNFMLHVYYDYQPVLFRVGDGKEYDDTYKFKIEMDEEISLPIFLNPEIKADSSSHRIIFTFMPSYDEYAKDKSGVAYNTSASVCQMYQLHFQKIPQKIECPISKFPITKAAQLYPYTSIPLMLNTDISNLNTHSFEGLKNPNKHYIASVNTEFPLNYIISNLSSPAETAAIFLAVGDQPIQINGQDYLWVDLESQPMALGELSFLTPKNPGLYDVVGFVIYDPFLPMGSGDISFPKTSIRFTLEVK